jgi:signal transduction histidine kinase
MVEDSHGLEILKEVMWIANSTLDLHETLDKIIQVIHSRMPIDACAIYLADEQGTHFHIMASSGLPAEVSRSIKLEIGKGITGWVAREKKPVALIDAMQDPRFVHFPEIGEEKYNSMFSMPILKDDLCIGVINLHRIEKGYFTAPEISLLESIGNQVAGCIRNAMLYTKSQMLLKEQTALYEISQAVQTTLKLEHGIWTILTGITMGEAGGFNRAMLFTLNDKGNTLNGMMALGPDSPEDANRIWTELSQRDQDRMQWMIEEADREEYKNSRLNQWVRTLQFPVREGENIIVDTVLLKQSFNIKDAKNHPQVGEDFAREIGVNAFATVPLMAHKEVLGVILVDNRYNNKAIAEEQLRLLGRFATHAGWVIENARLFTRLLDTNRELLSTKEQLIQSEKLAALGEMSAEVAHEIKNPLVSIGGFARRLQAKMKSLPSDYQNLEPIQKVASYSNIIVREVDRLEKLLEDILIFSKTGTPHREECRLDELLQEVIYLFKSEMHNKNIQVHHFMEEHLPSIFIDRQQVKQVLINLFYNAIDCMPEGGKLTTSVSRTGHPKEADMITFSISDTGVGIPPEIFENIFNPFFTTKNQGTGLGLSICRKIITRHGGTIDIENNIGQGVTVYIHLPLKNSAKYYKS